LLTASYLALMKTKLQHQQQLLCPTVTASFSSATTWPTANMPPGDLLHQADENWTNLHPYMHFGATYHTSLPSHQPLGSTIPQPQCHQSSCFLITTFTALSKKSKCTTNVPALEPLLISIHISQLDAPFGQFPTQVTCVTYAWPMTCSFCRNKT
jgi:hypothetical protein